MSENEFPSPGWEAIDTALQSLYGDQQPHHYGTILPWGLGGNDPLRGISVYERQTPFPHWHFITYGLTELYEKESDDANLSGYGFELTFRLKKGSETAPPTWALSLLQNIARYVFQTGNAFKVGHYLNCNGPIALTEKTKLGALLFTDDPELGNIDSPHGAARFIQMTGITEDEEDAIKCWNSEGVSRLLNQQLALLQTDLARPSILEKPETRQYIERMATAEGSSSSFLYYHESSAKLKNNNRFLYFQIGAYKVLALKAVLAGRLPFGKTLLVQGSETAILFKPGEITTWQIEDDLVVATLSKQVQEELIQSLVPKAKTVSLLSEPNFTLIIERSAIEDSEGNIVEYIG